MKRKARSLSLGLVGVALLSCIACSSSGTTPPPTPPPGPLLYSLVRVANPGNANDSTGYGGVAYIYQIGKYEVSISQYTTFLNAVAATDAYGLYDSNMSTDLNSAGITRSGSSGSYTYSVMDNGGSSANRPITYVSWFDAARFANWMANGQPSGAQTTTTTENGSYALNGATSGMAIPPNMINPNTASAPAYYIPTENEWYKAAYYNPTLNSGAGGYYIYATQSNSAPGNSVGSAANQANYFTTVFSLTQNGNYVAMTQNYLTDVGAFSSSGSYYGTFDQGGNVWEWNDLDGSALPYRGIRGGYWWAGTVPMQSLLYSTDSLTRVENGLGFRLSSTAP